MTQKTTLLLLRLALMVFVTGCASTAQQANKQKSAELRMEIGVSHLERNNLPLALKELLAAQELDPKNPYIQNNLGIVYYMREKPELAIKHFSEAVRLSTTFTEAKNNLARLYIEQKQYKKAGALLEDVVSDLTYTNIDSAYFNYGLFYFNQKKFEQAKAYFSKVLNNKREDCLTQVYYARTLLETSFTKQASEQLDKATQFCVYEQADDAHFYSAIAHYRSGNKARALARFEELIKIFPEGKHRLKSSQMIQLIRKDHK